MPSTSSEHIMDSGQQPSRPSTSDGSAPHGGPVPMFDLHLRYLSDSYLGFFQERRRIEETYIESLLRLHKKVKAVDAYLDGSETSTARSAWNEVRDHCEREAQTRQAFLTSLVVDILNPLAALRETQDRTRKRIKEDLKESSIAYNEYADNALPKLKRNYMRKCQDVEDYKAAAANVIPSQPLSPGEGPAPKLAAGPAPPPVVTAPQPLRPITRRPSGSNPASRNRSPSSSTALSDLAHQGKRQLNQLMTFLDKGNTVKEGLGGRSDNALRSVRAKREADEADKEYRKGVHWLETLRIRRMKILEAGYMSLEIFIAESAERLKHACQAYTDTLAATSTTQTQLSAHLRDCVAHISPATDVAVIAQRIPRLMASVVPRPVLYTNYAVGECHDLIFGVSLVDYAQSRALGDGEIPKIVRMCLQEVDTRGLESEGIYRVSGRHAVVQELQRRIERSERAFKFNPSTDDVYVVSSLLKLYLRELPEPVFRFSLQDRIQHSEDFDDHKSNNFALLRAKMRRLPPIHQATLRAVIEHLARVVQRSSKNKMDVKNLAIVFGSVIFGEDEMPKGGAELLTMQSYQDSLMEDLIENAHALFDDRTEPPLPPAPSGEAPAKYAYGSSHTKVSNMPPPLTTPRRDVMAPPVYPTPEDFTPQVPSRPPPSIHPSARGVPMTSPARNAVALPPSPSHRTVELSSPPAPIQGLPSPVLPPAPAPIQGLPTPVLPPRPTAASPSPTTDTPAFPPRPPPATPAAPRESPTPPPRPSAPPSSYTMPPPTPPPPPSDKARSATPIYDSHSSNTHTPPSPTHSATSSAGHSLPSAGSPIAEVDEAAFEGAEFGVRQRAYEPPGSAESTADSFTSAVSSHDDPDTTPRLPAQRQSPVVPTVPFPALPARTSAESERGARLRGDAERPAP